MKSPILFSAIFGITGGAIGGLVATTSGAASHSADLGATVEVAQLRDTVDELRSLNEVLKQRMDLLENRPVVSDTPARVNADETKAGTEDLAPELQDLVASLRSKDQRLPDTMVEEISQVIADIKAKEDAQRKEDQKKRDAERLEERLTEMAKELGLSPFQVNEMRKVLTDLEAKRDAMRDAMRDGPNGDWEKMRTAMEQLRTDTKTELSRFLNGDQLQKYDDEYANRGFGGRGNRGPGGGGNGGGGGRGPGGNATGGTTGSTTPAGNGG